jgi:hypothetical protein
MTFVTSTIFLIQVVFLPHLFLEDVIQELSAAYLALEESGILAAVGYRANKKDRCIHRSFLNSLYRNGFFGTW